MKRLLDSFGALFGRQNRRKRAFLQSLVNEHSQPNADAMVMAVRDLDIANMNIKAFGYDLARRLAAALPIPQDTAARHVGLATKLSTQADLESDWAAHWSSQLHTPVLFHRKLWEVSYVLQAIYEEGHLRASARGLGFGCGTEVTPSYLASHGVAITVTDLEAKEAQAAGWAATNQHAASLEQAFHAHLVARDKFDELVSLRYVDMTAIPTDLTGYDFCWSMCALEHLGTIRKGLDFIENSLKTLRPGGLAVHTTEFNINPDGPTIDNWPTVLFQQKHFEELAARLRAQGHYVAELNFDYGDKPMDKFIDIPPWTHNMPKRLSDWFGASLHLKLSVDGFPCTCIGILVRKAG
jgi:SAM-dependent methyltransferase